MISGVVLAGGQGSRMDGVDKGLVLLGGRPLVQWAAAGLIGQVDELWVSVNRNAGDYRALGFTVTTDRVPGFHGPLAGLHSALSVASYPLLVAVPCDSPGLPPDLVSRLHARLVEDGADIAVARTVDRVHPVFCLCRKSLVASLAAYLAAGGRGFQRWLSGENVVEVSFDDQPGAFENINTAADLARCEENIREYKLPIRCGP